VFNGVEIIKSVFHNIPKY